MKKFEDMTADDVVAYGLLLIRFAERLNAGQISMFLRTNGVAESGVVIATDPDLVRKLEEVIEAFQKDNPPSEADGVGAVSVDYDFLKGTTDVTLEGGNIPKEITNILKGGV